MKRPVGAGMTTQDFRHPITPHPFTLPIVDDAFLVSLDIDHATHDYVIRAMWDTERVRPAVLPERRLLVAPPAREVSPRWVMRLTTFDDSASRWYIDGAPDQWHLYEQETTP